jgi:hypothetical protein
MDIFISWSGPRSGVFAEALKKWLPKIVNAFKPWLSSADIDKGSRWSTEVAGKRVPQFQATKATKEHIASLLKTLNRALGDEAMPETHIDEAFEVWWPKLAAEIDSLPPDGPATRPHRTERELLEEIVDWVRGTNAQRDALLKEATRRVGELSEKLASLEAARARNAQTPTGPADYPTGQLRRRLDEGWR